MIKSNEKLSHQLRVSVCVRVLLAAVMLLLLWFALPNCSSRCALGRNFFFQILSFWNDTTMSHQYAVTLTRSSFQTCQSFAKSKFVACLRLPITMSFFSGLPISAANKTRRPATELIDYSQRDSNVAFDCNHRWWPDIFEFIHSFDTNCQLILP